MLTKRILFILFFVSSITFGQQFARPIADLDNTGVWVTAPLWSKIDESVGSGDADSIQADGTPISSEPFTVDLGTVTDPVSSTNHTIRVRVTKTTSGGSNYDFIAQLRQGYVSEASQGTLIGTLTQTIIAETATTYTYTLSGGEADSITDYSDLQLRCYVNKNGGGAARNVTCYDVELQVPAASGGTRRVFIIN